MNEFQLLLKTLDRYVDRASVRTALDLGSRDGLVAADMHEAFPNARIFAFECNPEALDTIHKNVHNLDRVFVIPKAVHSINGIVSFFPINPKKTVTPHADGNIGASSLFRAKPGYPPEIYSQDHIQVSAIRLDYWATEWSINGFDVVWMDLQGGELNALEGMGTLLETARVVYTEVEYQQIYTDQPLADRVRKKLNGSGFEWVKTFYHDHWFGDELFVRSDVVRRTDSWLRRWWRSMVARKETECRVTKVERSR